MNIEQVDEDVYIFISQTMPITRRTQFYGLIQLVSAGLKITREKKTHTFQAIERKYMKNWKATCEILSTNWIARV